MSQALDEVSRPSSPTLSTGEKRQYSDDLSRTFSEALEESMRSHFPATTSGEGTGTNAASAAGIKSIDVAFNIEGLFLGLGLSVKVVGLPEGDRGYTHNFKRLTEEWTLESVNYHRYMPYAIIVGVLFLPAACMSDRVTKTSLCTAFEMFAAYRGRGDPNEDADLLEQIYIGVYETNGPQRGDVFFVSAEHQLEPRELPPDEIRLSFEDVKAELVDSFKRRNKKLRVHGMP